MLLIDSNNMEKERTKYPLLFSEAKLANLQLKNRVGLAPMTRISAEENGVPSEIMKKYYTAYARGGFSLLITEGTYPDEQHSQGYFNQPGIANEIQKEGWKEIVQNVHKEGAAIICQLMHAGALSQRSFYSKGTIGPSAIKPKGEQMEFYGGKGPYPVPKEMTKEDIKHVLSGFAQASKNAKDAGFDGIEIHGANGYLLDQFLTEYTNKRDDDYGGCVENRIRLLVETIRVCREEVGKDFLMGVRISQSKVNDYTYKWAGKESDAAVIFKALGEAGIDYVHITEFRASQAAFQEGGPTLASLAKKYGNMPVLVNGSLDTPEQVEEILHTAEADLITLGKSALANKDWVFKVANRKSLNPFKGEMFFEPNAKIKDFEIS